MPYPMGDASDEEAQHARCHDETCCAMKVKLSGKGVVSQFDVGAALRRHLAR